MIAKIGKWSINFQEIFTKIKPYSSCDVELAIYKDDVNYCLNCGLIAKTM